MANTGVSGQVSRSNYNHVDSGRGAVPGIRQQGMRSMAEAEADLRLQQRLLADALKRGKAEARAAAQVIGGSRMTLQSIRSNSERPKSTAAHAAVGAVQGL